jgi:uncharacterized tellurite resistance protein B-like protein
MLNKIKNFLEGEISIDKTKDGEEVDRTLMLGIGVLMLQMAGADNDYAPEEVQSCFRTLEKHFGISDEEAMAILEEAENQKGDKEKVSSLLESLNAKYNDSQKQLIMALIWKVVVADDKIESFELRTANQLRVRLQLSEEQAEEARKMAFARKV